MLTISESSNCSAEDSTPNPMIGANNNMMGGHWVIGYLEQESSDWMWL